MQGAVAIFLSNYVPGKEVIYGVTVSGRNIELTGVEEMVGPFINTLPLKIILNMDDNVILFLKNIQKQTQKLNNFAYTPLSEIQSWAKITNKRQSLFDVILVFENYPFDEALLNSISDFDINETIVIEETRTSSNYNCGSKATIAYIIELPNATF